MVVRDPEADIKHDALTKGLTPEEGDRLAKEFVEADTKEGLEALLKFEEARKRAGAGKHARKVDESMQHHPETGERLDEVKDQE